MKETKMRETAIVYGIVNKPVATIYEGRYQEKISRQGTVSAISDEGLYGMVFAATGGEEGGFVPVRAYYGYTGYVKADDLIWGGVQDVRAWESPDLMVVSGFYVDVMSIPASQGVRLIGLYRGSIIRVLELPSSSSAPGWVKVGLADGRTGYMREEFLWTKEFSQAGAWNGELPQKSVTERIFRRQVVNYALTYMGTQYRWGGRSTAGLDCSGYASACYMLGGILIYRDAKIVEGYPVHEIPRADMKLGDLLYFPGHMAMYVGDGRYLHSTGKAGCSGVRMNSLTPGAHGYRNDLAESLYAVGSIF